MGNLAHQIQRQQQERKHEVQQPASPKIHRKKRISAGEKILLLTMGVLLACACIFVVSNYASIYSTSKNIQKLEQAIEKQQKVNGELELNVAELSNPERIWEIAKNNGMSLNGNNVKVVQ